MNKVCRNGLHTYPANLKKCPECYLAWKEKHKDELKDYAKSRYVSNRSNEVAQRRRYYQDNKDKVRDIIKCYRDLNKEKIKADKAKYYQNNKVRLISNHKRYYEINKDNPNQIAKRMANLRKYQAAKLHRTPPWLTKEQLNSIELYYKTAKWVESVLGEPIHVDHVIPLQGKEVSGLHVPWNLQLLTARENIIKGNKISS